MLRNSSFVDVLYATHQMKVPLSIWSKRDISRVSRSIVFFSTLNIFSSIFAADYVFHPRYHCFQHVVIKTRVRSLRFKALVTSIMLQNLRHPPALRSATNCGAHSLLGPTNSSKSKPSTLKLVLGTLELSTDFNFSHLSSGPLDYFVR